MQVINTYFPHAARPDHLNDFGMTSPKAISKSFTHYAVKHKQLQLRILRIPQIPGEYKISKDCRKGSEVAFRSKRWLFPMLLKSHELVLLATSYYLTGRFNPQKELERHPSLAVAKLDEEIEVAQQQRDLPAVVSLKAKRVELRSAVLGKSADWSQYKQSLREIAASDAGSGVPPDFLREPGTTSASVDEQGRSWLEVSLTGQTRTVGASISAINADSSDPKLAFRFMLNRVQSQLQTSARNREAIPQFRRDWQLMLAAHKGLEQALAEARESGSLSPVLPGHNQP
jgi:hypothetical protein